MAVEIPERAVVALLEVDVADPQSLGAVPASDLIDRDEAEAMLRAALPHLLPDLFVAPNGDGEPTIWRRTGSQPESLLRGHDAPELFDVLAALLPTED